MCRGVCLSCARHRRSVAVGCACRVPGIGVAWPYIVRIGLDAPDGVVTWDLWGTMRVAGHGMFAVPLPPLTASPSSSRRLGAPADAGMGPMLANSRWRP
jgi:hypothetical protein